MRSVNVLWDQRVVYLCHSSGLIFPTMLKLSVSLSIGLSKLQRLGLNSPHKLWNHIWLFPSVGVAPEQLPADGGLLSCCTPGAQLLIHTLTHIQQCTNTLLICFPPVFLHMGNSSVQNTHVPHAKVSTTYKLKHTKTHGHKNILTQV